MLETVTLSGTERSSLCIIIFLLYCHYYAEGGAIEVYCNRAVCHSVRLLQVFLVAH